jgi:hypothetical protein
MKPRMWAFYLAVGLLGFMGPGPARAQGPRPTPRPNIGQPSRPTVSPYLNLLRRGNSPAFNYYTLVRPQQQFQQSVQQLQQDVAALPPTVGGQEGPSGLPTTGHPTQFMNYSHYFFNQGGQASPSRSSAAPTQQSRGAGRRR